MRTPKHELTIRHLLDNGWQIARSATYNGYRSAGTTEKMQSKDGYDYIRVFHGKTASKANSTYQITTVLMRESEVTI